jgi:hypothetical protein
MPGRPNSRNWNDVQTAIATVAVVTTLGLWNLFAQPLKTVSAKVDETTAPPPPTEPPVVLETTAMPKVKIMFTQVAPQTFVDTQPKPSKNNNNHNNNNNNGGGNPVTQTRSS